MKAWTRWQDWLALVVGAWVFVSPWIFAVEIGSMAAWTAWVLGGLIVLVALWALAMPDFQWSEYIQILLGAALFVSPWVINFTDNTNFTWSAWIAGVVLAALSLWSIYVANQESGTMVQNR
jgi:phosphoglycerol transferase MdoB-like AlkP superfamily enzyme